jgi:hypothetical protein
MENINQKNPLLEPEDYLQPYQKSIDNLKNDPAIIEFDKLCYEIFHMNPQGKRFLELAIEKFVIPAKVQMGTPTYQVDVIWAEGYKQPFREILNSVKSHQQRIQAGNQ